MYIVCSNFHYCARYIIKIINYSTFAEEFSHTTFYNFLIFFIALFENCLQFIICTSPIFHKSRACHCSTYLYNTCIIYAVHVLLSSPELSSGALRKLPEDVMARVCMLALCNSVNITHTHMNSRITAVAGTLICWWLSRPPPPPGAAT
jgi:hypothetical protein